MRICSLIAFLCLSCVGLSAQAATYQLSMDTHDWNTTFWWDGSNQPGSIYNTTSNAILIDSDTRAWHHVWYKQSFDASAGLEYRLKFRANGDGGHAMNRPWLTNVTAGARWGDASWNTYMLPDNTWYYMKMNVHMDGSIDVWMAKNNYIDLGGTQMTHHFFPVGHARAVPMHAIDEVYPNVTFGDNHRGNGTWMEFADPVIITETEGTLASPVPAPFAAFTGVAMIAGLLTRQRNVRSQA